MDGMRFLFFAGGWIVGGLETAFLSLMKNLLERGHQPTAVVSGWTDGELSRLLDQAGIPAGPVGLARCADAVAHRLDPARTARAVPARRSRAPDAPCPGRPFRRPPSQSDPSLLALHRQARAPDAGRCRQARHRPQWRAATGRAAVRRPVRLGIVGRVVEQKQHGVLLEACALLQQRLRDAFCLDIVGVKDGPFAAALDSRIAALGLGDIVRWTGFPADRDRLYGELDIVVAPGGRRAVRPDRARGGVIRPAGGGGRAPARFPNWSRTAVPACCSRRAMPAIWRKRSSGWSSMRTLAGGWARRRGRMSRRASRSRR